MVHQEQQSAVEVLQYRSLNKVEISLACYALPSVSRGSVA